MEDFEKNEYAEHGGEDVFSKPVRAGKRTYFFDVKATRSNDLYITLTESKRRMDREGRFSYEKHKIFLYREDFEKFTEGLKEVIDFVRQRLPEDPVREEQRDFTKVDF
ncbi:MAG: PUR family DNA/RNA-binding protein [Bacteroidales bacterium]|nr:PUR family DNA/RNA-binding protein [Bacteroidales bacterium]